MTFKKNLNVSLPIEKHMDAIRCALSNPGKAVIDAPPGSGKTTCVPLLLLDERWLKGKCIIMLEPRRLAARAAALRMADLLSEPVGKTVGYQVKNDRIIGPETRIMVVTEGILTRMIQSDPMMDNVGLVIFDEFHERNIQSDLGLALCMEISEALRDDLRILIMSATLDPGPISKLMGNAPVIQSQGQMFPVETRYLSEKTQYTTDRVQLLKTCSDTVIKALNSDTGDILVFLPGVGEIKQVKSLLDQRISSFNTTIHMLYGDLDKKTQDYVIQPSQEGKRKIVLSTSIAETSLTIEGVRVVVDSGLTRTSRFFSGTGMSRLITIPVSRASADQRRGRAGRLGHGVCYRLWTESDHMLLHDFNKPEIITGDLTPLIFELALWGVQGPDNMKFLDAPPKGSVEQAFKLLRLIGALDQQNTITPHGKELAHIGIHPRLSHMMIMAQKHGMGKTACRIAAILEERDFLQSNGEYRESDIRIRLEYLDKAASHRNSAHMINSAAVRVLKTAELYERRLKHPTSAKNTHGNAGRILSYAYPERIAMLKNKGMPGIFKTASGSTVTLPVSDSLSSEPFIVCAILDGKQGNARVYLAASYSQELLEEDFHHAIETHPVVMWDERSESIVSIEKTTFGELVLNETPLKTMDHEGISSVMRNVIRNKGISVLPWTVSIINLQSRAIFVKRHCKDLSFPDLNNDALMERLDEWLGPYLTGVRSLVQLKKIDFTSCFSNLLSWDQLRFIDMFAPSHLIVPSGSRIQLNYGNAESGVHEFPVLAVRLQEMFGLSDTPKIANGVIPVTLHLLSPAGRPMQITRDLRNFWLTTYHDVKKDLKGRYPKHYWPEEPLSAMPTNKTKKRMNQYG